MQKVIYTILIVLSILMLSCQKHKTPKTELILMGTLHQPLGDFTADRLYGILETIQPDVILCEGDSSFFSNDFKNLKVWDSNENNAVQEYIKNYEVKLRPYDFTGRNEYRIALGSRPTDKKATRLLDSLYKADALKTQDKTVYASFELMNDTLMYIAKSGAKYFNSFTTDSIVKNRQYYQYEKLAEIMSHYPIFENTYHVKKDGDSISYMEGYRRAYTFWNMRNKAMAKHILHFVDEDKGKKIIVLNGFFHRYYLNLLLRPEQEAHDFVIKDFYEY